MQRRFLRPRFERRFDRGFDRPVKMNETYDVEITEVGAKGDGIARINNFVIFVPNGKKGDKCKVKITLVRPRFAIGEKVEKPPVKEEKVEEEELAEIEEEPKEIEKVEEGSEDEDK